MNIRSRRLLSLSMVLVFLLCTSMAMAAPEQSGEQRTFSDVSPQNSNALFINYLTNKGLISGFPDGTFRPDTGLTRAEAAALIVRAADLNTGQAAQNYSDVSSSHWAADNIAAATSAELFSGFPDGTFRPDAILTRAQGISLVLRLSDQPNSNVELPTLEDVTSEHWAARPIAVGIESGMVSLTADRQRFLTEAPFTRGDMARALGVLLTKDPNLYSNPLVGEINVTKGQAYIVRNEETIKIDDNDAFMVGDTIKTNANGNVEITFPDGSGLLLKENTELTINESRGRSYLQANGTPGTAIEWLHLDLKQGKLVGALASNYQRDNVAQLPVMLATSNKRILGEMLAATTNPQDLPWYQQANTKRVKVKVDMPWGVAAVRGTFWMNNVDESGRSSTSVLVGQVDLTAGGRTETLGEGQASEIRDSGQPPEPPQSMSRQERQEWVDTRDWAEERARIINERQEAAPPPPPPVDQPEDELEKQKEEVEEQEESFDPITDIVDEALNEAESSTEYSDSSSSDSDSSGDNTSTTMIVTPYNITVTLKENTDTSNGLPLAEKEINFYISTDEESNGTWLGKATTSSNGIATFPLDDITLDYIAGQKYYYVAEFEGDESVGLDSSRDSSEYSNVGIDFTISPYSAVIGHTTGVVANVTLKDKVNGEPLAGQEVILRWVSSKNGQQSTYETIAILTTDSNGNATYDITNYIQDKNNGGTVYFITDAKYKGNVINEKYYSSAKAEEWLELHENIINLQLSDTTLPATLTEDVYLQGSIKNVEYPYESIPIDEVNISIISGDTSVTGSVYTDTISAADGNINYYVPNNVISQLPVGYHSWKATVNNEVYGTVEAVADLHIGGTEINIDFWELSILFDNAQTIKVDVQATANNELLTVPIQVYIDDTIIDTSLYSGDLSLSDLGITAPGSYKLEVKLEGVQGDYAPASYSNTLKVGVLDNYSIRLTYTDKVPYLETTLKFTDQYTSSYFNHYYIANEDVNFYIDIDNDYDIEENEFIGTATTDSNGVAKLQVPTNYNLDLYKYYKVKATFAGNTEYASHQAWGYVKFSNTDTQFNDNND
ncbi:MAG: hypothetical protein FH758_06930 [Firmicutes bacterium]|nr:hypothetical protein [Bacillota bacterium]